MRYEQKQITKADGRYLVFYHFPDSANPEQAEAFQSAEAVAEASAASGAGAGVNESHAAVPTQEIAPKAQKDTPGV